VNCKQIEENLLEVVESLHDGTSTSATKRHLAECPHCSELVEFYQEALSPPARIGADSRHRIWRRVQKRLNRAEAEVDLGQLIFGRAKLIGYSLRSLVAALAVGLGIYIGSGLGNPRLTFAEEIAYDYTLLLNSYDSGSLASAYLNLELENGGESE
jgi:hypothetical protein